MSEEVQGKAERPMHLLEEMDEERVTAFRGWEVMDYVGLVG